MTDTSNKIQSIAEVFERLLLDHRTTKAGLKDLKAVSDASADEIRAARLLASAAVYLAAASTGSVSRERLTAAEREVRWLRDLCWRLESPSQDVDGEETRQ